jgi:hypothetical protein
VRKGQGGGRASRKRTSPMLTTDGSDRAFCRQLRDRARLKPTDERLTERASLVRHIVPGLVPAPDLEARDRDREEERREAKVGVAVHADTFRPLGRRPADRTEECMAEVACRAGQGRRKTQRWQGGVRTIRPVMALEGGTDPRRSATHATGRCSRGSRPAAPARARRGTADAG